MPAAYAHQIVRTYPDSVVPFDEPGRFRWGIQYLALDDGDAQTGFF